MVGNWDTSDAQECLEECRDLDGCEYFTQFDQDAACVGFADCVTLSEGTCDECYTGSVSCPGKRQALSMITLYID